MRKFYMTLFLVVSCVFVTHADELNSMKVEADSAFAKEDYQEALERYLQVADSTESAQVCYNLGCTYYRMDSIAKSILWFERALLIDPGNGDIRFNLELTRSKTIDKITAVHEMFFVNVYRSIVNMMNLRAWAVTCIVMFALFLVCLSLYFFFDRMMIRKAGFFLSIFFFVMVVLGNVCALQQRSYSANRSKGVIMDSAVTVKSTPSESGNDLFVIHEGTSFVIQDNSMKEWCEIRIADGKVGWILKKQMEVI